MRIVHLDFDDLGNSAGGGQARRTFEINRRLARRHQITVYTSRYPGSCDKVVDGVTYRRVGLPSFPANMLAFFALMPVLARRAGHADLLVEDFTSPLTCGMTPLFTSTPVIGSAQFFFAHFMAAKYKLPLDLLERHGLRAYRQIIAPTRRIAGEIHSRHPRAQVSIIPAGIEPQFFDLPQLGPLRGDGRYLAFVGRVDLHQKGIDTLVQALARLPLGRRPPLRIYGAGRDVPQLTSMIQNLHLGDHVTYQGRVSGEQRMEALAGARLVCVPSRYETFGIVVGEAMAAARPVIGTAGIGFEEILGDQGSGRLVPPDDPGALAAAIEELWNDPTACRRIGADAREQARRFDWDRIALEQEALYEQVARTRGPKATGSPSLVA